MVILTTLYNSEEYVLKTLESIKKQNYKDFKCYITDDISTDNSPNIVETFIKNDDRFILIRNKDKHYQPGNYNQIIRGNYNIGDNEVCVEVDGDDWLPDNDTLGRIAKVYENEDIWIANGRFIYSDGRKGFAAPPRNISNIRNEAFTASHIRTWRAFLWRNIKEDDLKDSNGLYYSVAGDLSFMFPMLEMAGELHYKFMMDINYIYNEQNPINDHKVNMGKVNNFVQEIRKKPKYDLL